MKTLEQKLKNFKENIICLRPGIFNYASKITIASLIFGALCVNRPLYAESLTEQAKRKAKEIGEIMIEKAPEVKDYLLDKLANLDLSYIEKLLKEIDFDDIKKTAGELYNQIIVEEDSEYRKFLVDAFNTMTKKAEEYKKQYSELTKEYDFLKKELEKHRNGQDGAPLLPDEKYVELEKRKSELENKIQGLELELNNNEKDYSSLLNPNIRDDYKIAILDNSLTAIPFIFDKYMISDSKLKAIVSRCSEYNSDMEKARVIFDWFQANIEYDFEQLKRLNNEGNIVVYHNQNTGEEWVANDAGKERSTYHNSEEVYKSGKGVCGEQAFLYVLIARFCGLKSSFVNVDRDYKGQDVGHACAGVWVNGNLILADPAYHTFDIHHQTYEIWNDKRVYDRFKWQR